MPVPISILLVGADHATARGLASTGYAIERAADAADGLLQALRLIPKLILVNRLLPDGDGFDFVARLHAEPSLAHCSVILLGEEPLAAVQEVAVRATLGETDELRDSEERFRFLLQSVPMVAIQGYAVDGTVQYWNSASEVFYGFSREEAIGGNLLDLIIPEEMKDGVREALRGVERGDSIPNGELLLVRKDGTRIPVYSSHTVVRRAGKPAELFCIDIDLTERRRLEKQFLRGQRMESIGTLAGGIAHDLNNVLAPILLSIELLKDTVTTDEARATLAMIESSAERGAEMVKQVLTFARGVEGKRQAVSVADLVGELEKIVSETFPRQIRLVAHLGSDLYPLYADPVQLHQVLLNLCVNARDAMPEGGTITVTANNLRMDARYAALDFEAHEGPYVLLDVEDTGSGIPADAMEQIWDPFFTTKELGKGTGLGLSTSLAIVRSHGGFMRAESEPGRWTRVRVYLPADAVPAAAPEPTATVGMPRGRGELILVVDDESVIRNITRKILENFGYRVVVACDGVEALAIYGELKGAIRLVLTDMMMPVMDGPATINRLLALDPALPIIAASGLDVSSTTAHAFHEEVKAVLSKPFTAEALLRTVREVLDRSME